MIFHCVLQDLHKQVINAICYANTFSLDDEITQQEHKQAKYCHFSREHDHFNGDFNFKCNLKQEK